MTLTVSLFITFLIGFFVIKGLLDIGKGIFNWIAGIFKGGKK